MKPGMPEKVEQEYIRHGTTTLIASRNVATGHVIGSMGPTRKEGDFVHHIRGVIKADPDASYVFVMDQLNTHKSESLVRFVAYQCGISQDSLDVKGQSGVLKNMGSRSEFLTNPSHRVRIVYTPKHCSWLNQIECWFSILSRRLLNIRSSFSSVEILQQKVNAFINYYNKHLARPFRWMIEAKILQI